MIYHIYTIKYVLVRIIGMFIASVIGLLICTGLGYLTFLVMMISSNSFGPEKSAIIGGFITILLYGIVLYFSWLYVDSTASTMKRRDTQLALNFVDMWNRLAECEKWITEQKLKATNSKSSDE